MTAPVTTPMTTPMAPDPTQKTTPSLQPAALDSFPRLWSAEILAQPPLIAPARQFTYPHQIAGEEDSLARGALQLLVRPTAGPGFLATCALGFNDPSMPTGIFSSPRPNELCALAGGYAYLIDTASPSTSTLLPQKPVTALHALPHHHLLLFVGFHNILAWGTNGLAWSSQRLSWEGVRLTSLDGDTLLGTGWNLLTDRELPFTLDLRTGHHEGGAFTPPAPAPPPSRS